MFLKLFYSCALTQNKQKLMSKFLVSKPVSGFTEFRSLYHYSQEVLIANELPAHVTHRGNSDNKQTGLNAHLVTPIPVDNTSNRRLLAVVIINNVLKVLKF